MDRRILGALGVAGALGALALLAPLSVPVDDEELPPAGRFSPVAVWELGDGGREFWRMQFVRDGGRDYIKEVQQPCEWQPVGTAPLQCDSNGRVIDRGGMTQPCAVRMCRALEDAGVKRPKKDRDGGIGQIIRGLRQ